jgi:PBP1b-binding outer membrane lipoprotein LpoB
MNYGVVVIDSLSGIPPEAMPSLKILALYGRLVINKQSDYSSLFEKAISYQTPDDLIAAINTMLPPDIELNTPSQDIRYRHVVKEDNQYYIIFNEGTNIITSKLKVSATGKRQLIDAATAEAVKLGADETLTFSPHELKIIRVTN